MKTILFRLSIASAPLIFAMLCLLLGLFCGYSCRPSLAGVDAIIVAEAQRFGLNPYLVKAVILTESSGRRYAVSIKGARGLMQLMPDTARQLAIDLRISLSHSQANISQPHINIRLGCYYLHLLLRRFHGDLYATLAAYNTGPNRVQRWLKRHQNLASRQVIAGRASRETRWFVRKVMHRYQQLCEEKS